MRTNIDTVDRVVRGVIGIWLLAVAVSAYRIGKRTIAAIAGIAGLGLLQNAVSGYCGGGQLLGVDTTTENPGR